MRRIRVGIVVISLILLPLSIVGTASASNTSAHKKVASGLTLARKQLKEYSGPVKLGKLGAPFTAAKLRGKSVELAVFTGANPALALPDNTFISVMKHFGITVFVCDGKGTPTTDDACVAQGIARHVTAIETSDTIPFLKGLVAKANQAKIPVFEYMTLPATGVVPVPHGFAGNAAQPFYLQGELLADWMIVHSHDKNIHVFAITAPDITGARYMTIALKKTIKKDKCKNCTVKVADVNAPSWSTDIAPATTTALEDNPSINYVVPEADPELSFANPAIKGISGESSKVKVLTTNGLLPFMEDLAHHTLVYLEVGDDFSALGYYEANQVLRALAGKPYQKMYTMPIRVFTRSNVPSAKLNVVNAANGAWYMNPAKVRSAFYKVWKG